MSWSIDIAGKPADVKAVVLADAQIPQPVKDAIAQVADGISAKNDHPHLDGIKVKGNGHFGPEDYWNGVTLEALGIKIAPSLPVEPPLPVVKPPAPDLTPAS